MFLVRLLKSKPLKSIFITILVIGIFAIGVKNMKLATGNDTLVSPDSKVYQDNLVLEKTFGGESVVVLYKSDSLKHLLTVDNLETMEGLEKQLEANKNIFSIISPVTLVDQMSAKKAQKYKDGLSKVIDGLDEMGGKLNEIGDNLINNSDSGNASGISPDKLAELNQGLAKMVEGQKKLQEGTQGLAYGFQQYGEHIKQIGTALNQTASKMQASGPEGKQQIMALKQLSQKLMKLSEQMDQTGTKAAALPHAAQQTAKGLENMQTGLAKQRNQLDAMQENQKQKLDQLKELGPGLKKMGNQLQTIGDNLATMEKYSDSMQPALPQTQKTLDHMIYDDNGKLRDVFDKLIKDDKYMMMSITFNGETTDAKKSEIVKSINTYLENHQPKTATTIVSGKPVLDGAIRSSMQDSMKKMMLLAIAIMIVVLLIVFKARWRLLPLGVILLAVIGTVGLMGWVSIPITMVSMAVFPILIGLGIDYAIQFQNRYSEELEEGGDHDETV